MTPTTTGSGGIRYAATRMSGPTDCRRLYMSTTGGTCRPAGPLGDCRSGDYARQGKSMHKHRARVLLFSLASIVAGFAYWWHADWWAYVQDSWKGPWPLFKLTWWEQ